MKRLALVVALALIAIPALVIADTAIDFFGAKSSGDKVTVEWKTGIEQSVDKFDVERAAYGAVTFDRIGTVSAKGSYTYYSYVDESGFQKKAMTLATLYQYRLKIYYTDGTFSYSKPTTVEHSVSSVRRTWGQIKEMFR